MDAYRVCIRLTNVRCVRWPVAVVTCYQPPSLPALPPSSLSRSPLPSPRTRSYVAKRTRRLHIPPRAGIEPATTRLKALRSTAELSGLSRVPHHQAPLAKTVRDIGRRRYKYSEGRDAERRRFEDGAKRRRGKGAHASASAEVRGKRRGRKTRERRRGMVTRNCGRTLASCPDPEARGTLRRCV